MTEPSPLTWDELDQLADYTAGTLTPQHTQHIAHLIATDPRWTTAHHTLQQTQPTITTALTTAAHHTPPIPPELTAKLETLYESPRPRHIPRRLLTGPRLRRPLLVGVAAVIAVVFGLSAVATLDGVVGGSNDSAELDAGPQSAPTDGAPPFAETPPVLFASGRDYTRETLQTMGTVPGTRQDDVDTEKLGGAGPLAELSTATRFAECAAAVRARHPGEVRAADFARYEGSPAVILRVERGSAVLIVVVGPECGRDGDPHELESVEVG